MARGAGTALLLLLSAAPAFAQEVGVSWMDRVRRSLVESDRAPLMAKPLDLQFSAGALAQYDDNIFLQSEDEEKDTILTGFVGARLTYAAPEFDGEADVLVNYDRYQDNEDVSDHEERFFGRARYAGARVSFEVTEIFRQESDPINVVFLERVERIVSTTLPRVSVDWGRGTALEAGADVTAIWYDDDEFEIGENVTYRAYLEGSNETPFGFTFLAQGGYQAIEYQEDGAPPDVAALYGRLGARGDLTPTLFYEVRVGVIRAETDEFAGGDDTAKHTTGEADLRIRYRPFERVTLWGEYARRLTFAGLAGEPFQVVDQAVASGEVDVTSALTLRARGEAGRSHGALGLDRDFWSVSAGGLFRILEGVVADASVTYRGGEIALEGADSDFRNWLASFGVAVTY